MANKNPKQGKRFRDSQGRFARVSKETASKAGKKGAKVSNKVQAEKRTLAQTLDAIIDVELSPEKVEQRIVNLGYSPEMAKNVTPRLMVALGFLNRCMFKSDPNAIKLLVELLGEFVETVRHEHTDANGQVVFVPKSQ